jgi:hypothetical protein
MQTEHAMFHFTASNRGAKGGNAVRPGFFQRQLSNRLSSETTFARQRLRARLSQTSSLKQNHPCSR